MSEYDKECCYKGMSKKVGGQSMPQDYHDEPYENEYEEKRESFYGKNGYDQSGMRRK